MTSLFCGECLTEFLEEGLRTEMAVQVRFAQQPARRFFPLDAVEQYQELVLDAPRNFEGWVGCRWASPTAQRLHSLARRR